MDVLYRWMVVMEVDQIGMNSQREKVPADVSARVVWCVSGMSTWEPLLKGLEHRKNVILHREIHGMSSIFDMQQEIHLYQLYIILSLCPKVL